MKEINLEELINKCPKDIVIFWRNNKWNVSFYKEGGHNPFQSGVYRAVQNENLKEAIIEFLSLLK